MNDSELCFLSANEVLALYRTKELSPVELLDALDRPDRGDRAAGECRVRPSLRRGPRRGCGIGRPIRRQGRSAPSTRGRSGRGQGGTTDGRPDQQLRLVGVRRSGRDHHSPDARAHPGRRRRHPHQDDDTRVQLRRVHPQPAVGHHPQPVEHRLHARAGRRAGPVQLSQPPTHRWPPGRTSGARSASRRRSAASSGTSRRSGGCRRCPRSTSISTATMGRWPALWPMRRC